MRIEKNYDDGKVVSVSLVSDFLKIDIYNAGSDLYWVLNDYKDDNEMLVSSDDDFYEVLDELYNSIKECDNTYDSLFNNESFIWYSEDYGEIDDAHKLIISKLDNLYSIKFIFNASNKMFNISGNCPICFCLSGSRNQNVAYLFSRMFLKYQYDLEDKEKVYVRD